MQFFLFMIVNGVMLLIMNTNDRASKHSLTGMLQLHVIVIAYFAPYLNSDSFVSDFT